MATTVAIALVEHNGHYLIGRRPDHVVLPGYYEFPGGKCLAGESPADCAVRECREETGLDVEVVRLRREVVHRYDYGEVHLHFFDCRPQTPPRPAKHGFVWVPVARLAEFRFPEANAELVAELQRAGTAGT